MDSPNVKKKKKRAENIIVKEINKNSDNVTTMSMDT